MLQQTKQDNYFKQAKNWADDYYSSAVLSRNRWRMFVLAVALPLLMLLFAIVLFLLPRQHLQPLLIHHYGDGVVTVSPIHKIPMHNRSLIESELVRYVVNRESYSYASYKHQHHLIDLMSNDAVQEVYLKTHDFSSHDVLIHHLQHQGTRSVYVESVVFLDALRSHPQPGSQQPHLAQIDFSITEHLSKQSAPVTIPLTALLAWTYKTPSSNPSVRWLNWDGFRVTQYQLHQRNINLGAKHAIA